MAVTLLNVVQRISTHVGLDPTVTALSSTDETNDLVQYINEAYEELLLELPPESFNQMSSGTLNLTNGTRLYSLPATAFTASLYDWSFTDITQSNFVLQFVTADYINEIDPNYKNYNGIPGYVYAEGLNQLGFYPVPNASFTVTYQFGTDIPATRLSNTTDTFLVPDRWVRFIQKRAQALYERSKGFPTEAQTNFEAEELLSGILVEAWEMFPTYLYDEGFAV